MQILDAVSTVHSILAMVKIGIPVWTALGVLAACCYIRVRSGSLNFLRERIWRILGGASDFKNPAMNERWERVSDFQKYRYSSGIKFQRRDQIAGFENWLEARQTSLEEALPFAQYFDLAKMDLRDPDIKKRQRSTAVLSFMCVCWMAFFGLFMGSDALIRVKASNIHFWVNSAEAHSAFSDAWTLTPESCAAEGGNLDASDKEVICKILTTQIGKQYVEDTMRSQREVGATMVVIGMAALLLRVISLLRAYDAHHFFVRTRPRSSVSPEATSPEGNVPKVDRSQSITEPSA